MEDNKTVFVEQCHMIALCMGWYEPNKVISSIIGVIFKQLAWLMMIWRFDNCFYNCFSENRNVVNIRTVPKSCKLVCKSPVNKFNIVNVGKNNWTSAMFALMLMLWLSITWSVFFKEICAFISFSTFIMVPQIWVNTGVAGEQCSSKNLQQPSQRHQNLEYSICR